MDYDFLRTNRSAPAAAAGGQPVPPEVRGWNWGAFFLTVFWGVGNNTWIALLVFVPIVGIFMPFVLGARGSVWAWKNCSWKSVEHFKRVQRRWAWAGVILWGGVFLLGYAPILAQRTLDAYVTTTIRTKILATLADNTETNAILGAPVAESKDGSPPRRSTHLASDRYELTFLVDGPKGRAIVEARGRRVDKEWTLDALTLRPLPVGAPIVILPRRRL